MFSVVGTSVLNSGTSKVQMAMVVDTHHFTLKNVFQLFQIDNESAYRIHFATHRDFQRVVVAVSVAVRTLTEDSIVFCLRPGIVPVKMGRGELSLPG